mmetsp:Transcript_36372/g.82657  ORF Transcript_36372/g.82657 Transcript_36372/m.82657 type:complete len:243 (-) Transcript_36372:114-842(-)
MRLRDVLRLELPENSAQVAVCEERVLLDVSDQGVLGVHHHVVVGLDPRRHLQLEDLLRKPAARMATVDLSRHVQQDHLVGVAHRRDDLVDLRLESLGGLRGHPHQDDPAQELVRVVDPDRRHRVSNLAEVSLVERDDHVWCVAPRWSAWRAGLHVCLLGAPLKLERGRSSCGRARHRTVVAAARAPMQHLLELREGRALRQCGIPLWVLVDAPRHRPLHADEARVVDHCILAGLVCLRFGKD